MTAHPAFRRPLLVAALALSCIAPPALASGGGGGASGPEPLKFTVNVGRNQYLMLEMMLEPADPKDTNVTHHLAAYKPRIQHAIILMLSGADPNVLRSREGKLELMDKIRDEANHIIHEDKKTGIKEVLFTNFVMQ